MSSLLLSLLLLLLSVVVFSAEQQFAQNAEVLQDAMRDPHERPDGEVFSSTFEMSRLLAREAQFSRDLHAYADELRSQLRLVQAVLDDIYPEGPLSIEEGEAEAYVSHPLNGLGMLRRMGAKLKGPQLTPLEGTLVDELGDSEGGLGRLNKLAERMKKNAAFFPDANNYMVGLSGVALLQEAYAINITAMAKGEIRVDERVYSSEVKPTWQDMAEMGEAAFEQGWLDTTITWLEEAKATAEREGYATDRRDGNKSSLSERIAQVKRVHDETLDKRGPVSHRHRCNQLPFDQKMAKKKKYRKARKEGRKGIAVKKAYELVPLFSVVDNHSKLHDNFQLMCHSDNYSNSSNSNVEELRRPARLDWPLRCYWHHLGDPHQRLGPMKLEEKDREPFAAVLHDFLSDSEMQHLKRYAGERLFRSRTGFTDNMHTTLTRTSKQTWLAEKYFSGLPAAMPGYDPEGFEPPPLPFGHERYLEVLDKPAFGVSLRLQAATGLRLMGPLSAESYQVANYGLGGQYSSHHDSNGFYEGRVDAAGQPEHYRHCRGVGDRFVTIMGYLTDVAYGGDTVFPLTGVRSPVERGAVLLWINLLSDGTRDEWTYHGGCPVAVGSKWITNKWVWYNDQFRDWPCHLQKGQRHDALKEWRSRSGIAPPISFPS